MKKFMKNTQGFTLVELIVVIAILGILAGVGTVGYSGYIKKANMAADEQLAATVTQAYAIACLENGVDAVDTMAEDIPADKLHEGVDVTSHAAVAAKIEEAYEKYFAGNESAELKAVSVLYFDKGVFKADDSVISELDFGNTGLKLKFNSRHVNALKGSVFFTMGTDNLLNKVNDVADVAKDLTPLQNNLFENEEFIAFIGDAVGMPGKSKDELQAAAGSLGLNWETLKANAAVLYAANNSTKMSQSEISSILSSGGDPLDKIGNVISSNNDDVGSGLAVASMYYGMYVAHAGIDNAPSNPMDVMTAIKNDSTFAAYVNSADGQKALEGYLGAMNMINDNTNNSAAVLELLKNGFNSSDLKTAVSTATGSNAQQGS